MNEESEPTQPMRRNELHRGKGLRRKTPLRQKPKQKKRKMNVAGLAPEQEYWRLKASVLARPPNGRCERCGARPAVDAHHRKLVSQGGPDVASNLAALCRECHSWCHAYPLDARAGGWIVTAGTDWAKKALLLWDGSVVTLNDEGGYAFQGYPR